MAPPMRRPDPPLTKTLHEEPYRFDFFQAVRLLLKSEPERVPVGFEGPPGQEIVRFLAYLSLSFPASAIDELTVPPRKHEGDTLSDLDRDVPQRQMTTTFFGLIGPLGALPTIYTESLIAMHPKKRKAALAFFDLFHHRLVSLFYRSWEKYNLPSLWERGGRDGTSRIGSDELSKHLFDFIGLGLEPLRDRQHVPDASLLYYAGLFAQQHRPTGTLERLLRDYFGAPFQVISFHGQWLRLLPEQQSRSGRAGTFNRLGIDTVAGAKVWDDQSKFRVRVGPLDAEAFQRFLPGGDLSNLLTDLVRFYVRGELDFDVQLVLKGEAVPFSKAARTNVCAQLGRRAWLKVRDFTHDAEDAVFRAPH